MDPAICDAMIQCLELRQNDPELAKKIGYAMQLKCMKSILLNRYFGKNEEQYSYFLRIMAAFAFGGNDEAQIFAMIGNQKTRNHLLYLLQKTFGDYFMILKRWQDYFDSKLVKGRRCLILFDDSQKAYEHIILNADLSQHPKVIWCPKNQVSIQPEHVEKLKNRLQVIFCQNLDNSEIKESPFYVPWRKVVDDSVSVFMSCEVLQKYVPIFKQQSYDSPSFAIEKRDDFLQQMLC